MDLLDRLLDHDGWATTQLLEVSRGLTDDQLDEAFDVGHRTLRATFAHMIYNVEVWTAMMNARPLPAAPDARSLPALTDRLARAHADFAATARRARDEGRLDDTFVDAFGGPMTFGGGILHLVLHDAEHRAEVLHLLTRLGVPDLPEIDHGLWDFKRRGY